jgi:tRNA (cmo5U34)-methyltransferase
MTKPSTDFFNQEQAELYDERNRKLAPISDNLHFLIKLVLEDLPVRSRILSVGAGTGAEILSLAEAFPEWSFVAVEPSLSMLNVCRARIQSAGLLDRCEFVHGFAQDLPARADFDAVLAILVAHFVKRDDRLSFFKNLTDRLRAGGYLVNAEISFDLDSAEFPSMLKNWESVQRLMGANPESLAALPRQLRDVLTVLSPMETETIIRKSGIDLPIRFFQTFMISGWYGVKSATT